MSKVLVDRELLENCCDAAKDAHAASLLKELEAILDKPAEAEGLDIIGYMDGDYRRDQPSIYIPHVRIVKSCAKGEALMTVTQHLAALSAVTADRDRLESMLIRTATRHFALQIQDRADDKKLDECLSEGIAMLEADRDQLRAEIERMRGMLDAALYYVPEHKHDLRELISAAMAAKEA